jgi:hypothetical protein
MLSSLKNILLTAVMVVGATMVTAGVTAVATMFMAFEATPQADENIILFGGYFAVILAAVVGSFFSVVSLTVAAVTMPPAIGLMRAFKLPRPLFDIVGGAAAGLICAAAAAGMLESLARAKGGGMPDGDMRLMLDICALFGGGALGYLRHRVLAPKGEAAALQPA